MTDPLDLEALKERVRGQGRYEGEWADDCLALIAEVERLRLAGESARSLIERHRSTRGTNALLETALSELDDVLPTVASTPTPDSEGGSS